MILLGSTSDILSLVTSGTAAIHVHISAMDTTAGTTAPVLPVNKIISSATTTTILAAPAGSTTRNVKFISIRNTDASASNTITLRHTDSVATVAEVFKGTLLAGQTLCYNDLDGPILIDAGFGRVQTPLVGRFLGFTFLTAASANFTTGAQTNTIKIRGVGGGGGGAGCTSVSSAASGGGGGAAGGNVEKTFAVSPNTAYAYTCGALGAGASGALGGTGGNSTFIVGATTVTAFGGPGAVVATAATTLTAYPGGIGPAVSTNGDLNGGGEPGQPGFILIVNAGSGMIGIGGAGGSGPFGGGGKAISAAGNGNSATGFGAGGGGAFTGTAAVRTGGSGTAGAWAVDEFS